MGTKNRQRRADKRRRHQHQGGSGPGTTGRGFNQLSVREVIFAAAGALREPMGGGRHRELLAWLAEGPPPVGAEIDAVLRDSLQRAESRHWSAHEVRRQAERRLGDRHAQFVADVIISSARSGQSLVDLWVAREGMARIEAVAVAIEVLVLVLSLPPMPKLGATPPTARRPLRSEQSIRMLEKVRALLAKAESTTFPEEAESLSAKAQELMARHAIDSAMVGAAGGGAANDVPTGMRLPVDDPYASPKSVLLAVVSQANRCEAVWSKGYGFSTVMGFEADLEFVEILYTSLLVQATSAMVAAGSQVDRYGRSRTRSFRQAFLIAYATRIGQRLREAEAASRASAIEQYGAALLPVLADRSAAVEAASAAAFPHVVTTSVTTSNAAGWAAGRAAADLASLAGRTEVPA